MNTLKMEAQSPKPVPLFAEKDRQASTLEIFQQEWGKNKVLPKGFEAQALLALSFYPELKNARVQFVLKKTKTPLMAMPTFWTTLMRSKKHRKYKVVISTQSIGVLDSILLKNLSFNAQVGVLGHELAHIAWFQTKSRAALLRLALGHLSKRYMDRFEFATDRATIDHGLGWQLLSWSTEVRQKLNLKLWKGADQLFGGNAAEGRERYMDPETIQNILLQHPLYIR